MSQADRRLADGSGSNGSTYSYEYGSVGLLVDDSRPVPWPVAPGDTTNHLQAGPVLLTYSYLLVVSNLVPDGFLLRAFPSF